MKSTKSLLMAMALTLQVATAQGASIVDAPHNGVHGVSCASCHSYSLWWRYSPANQSLTPSGTEIVNGVCNHCHDGSQPGLPVQHAHSSAVFTSTAHGTWESPCIACHDPHFQGQLEWVDTGNQSFPAGLYVVQGTISAVTAGSMADTTDLGYANVPADNQNGDWTDRGRWGKKNDNQQLDRGLILVVDTGLAENTYQVISADSSLITVKGTLSAADSGKTFGLIYGQLIRKEIATPASGKRQVTFFDPDTLYNPGGFTDHQALRQGICQVCHTATSHWTEDGLHDDHNQQMRCTSCHDRVQGFKPALPGHPFLSNTTPCTNCHQHGADDPLAIHGNLCQTCHTTPPQLRGDSANLPRVSRIGLDPAGADLGNGKTATACTYCHSAYFGGHSHDHSASVAVNSATSPLTANCLGCHPATTAPFVTTGEAHGLQGCATCHDLTSNGALLGAAATATAPYGECTSCHGGYFANHDHGATGGSHEHAVSLGSDTRDGAPCSLCHNGSGGGLASWSDILAEHQMDCGFCHNSQRTTNVGAAYTSVADVILQADAVNPVHCLECHANHTDAHQTLYVSAYEDGGQPLPVVRTTCTINCHGATFATSSADPKLHDSCTTCHTATATPITLTGSAAGKRVPEDTPFNSCYSCHGVDYFANHTQVDHAAVITTTSDDTCERCHNGDPIISATIHHALCSLCHDASQGGALTSLAVNGAGNCAHCHGGNWLTIHTAATGSDHGQSVAMTSTCSACHASTAGTASGIATDPADNTVHDSCMGCHDSQGRLIGSASGHQGGAECATCHGAFGSGVHATENHATRVSLSPACSSCHGGAEGTAGGIAVNPGNARIHNACASCHGATGALIGSAAGKSDSNSCESCHTLFAVQHANDDHALTVAMAVECSGCHAGAQGTLSGMPLAADGKRHAACASCHGATGALISIASGNGGGADCATCHGVFAAKHGAVDHSASVSASSECAGCHGATAGAVAGMPTSTTDNTVHDQCGQCHGTDGILIGSAAAHGPANACTGCHAQSSQHQGAHFLLHDATSDRGQSTNQPCNACHGADGADAGSIALDDWSEILTMHGNGSCLICHNASREVVDNQGMSQDPVRTVAGVISAAANPTPCLACHLDKKQPAAHGFDHIAAGIVSALARCVSCHDHANQLTGVHGTAQCTTCHDKTTAPVVLKGSAIGHGLAAVTSAGVPNTCGSCHTSQAADFLAHATPDHPAQGLVTNTSNGTCESCHGAADTINDAMMHQGLCSACHRSAPGASDDGTLIGSAAGKLGGGNCTTCHAIPWLTIHQGASPGISHQNAVGMTQECSFCHAGAAGTASGMPTDALDPLQHQGCASCHNSNGQLTGIAAGNPAPNSCSDCHGSFSAKHAATDHGALVAMASECSACHSASGSTVNPGDAKVHDSCATCHGADGALSGSASGHAGGGGCTLCHGGFASIHATKDHTSLVAISTDCSGCHGGAQGTAGGMPVGGAKQHAACASCHGSSGALISIASGNGGGAQCNSCHGLFAAKHAASDHAFRVALANDCADCHGGSEGTASGVPLNSTNHTRHDTCGQCHGATGTLSGSAAGKEGATSGAPNDCATCHGGFAGNHATVNHSVMVAMNSNCAGCHSAFGNTVNPGDPTVHDACTTCHLGNGRLSGSAAGQDGATLGGGDGGGDCSICHGGFANNHGAVDHASRVAMATECSACHTASGNTVDPDDAKVHDACTACHGADGTLTGSASGHAGGGDCTVCHGGFPAIHATQDHATVVALSTDCSGCHGDAQGTASGMPVGGSKQHAACASCHGSSGALISLAAGNGGGAQCNSCHGLFADKHAASAHAFRVALNSDCADCHAGSEGTAAGVPTNAANNTIHDTCGQCHGATGALSGSAAGKEGATVGTPNDCATCHGTFAGNHAAVNHSSMVAMNANCAGCHSAFGNTVNPGDAKVHDGCATCHLANGRLTGTAAGKDGATPGGSDGGGDCALCHGGFANNHASVDHGSRVAMASECSGCHTASGNTVDPGDAKVHDSCATCHAADGALSGSASGHAGGGSCTLCHGGFAAIHASTDHTTQVALSTDCSGCHGSAQGTAGGMPVGGAKQHAACASCHGNTGALISIAAGNGGGAQCNSCHGLFAAKHASSDHAFRVALNSACADCHAGSEGAAAGVPLGSANNTRHDTCGQCHGTTGALSGSAAGKEGATSGAPNDCATCHGGFAGNHATVNHSSMVAMNSNCAGCHSAVGNTVNPGDAKVHDGCATCHLTNGRLTGAAAGKDGATLGGGDGGGDCALCHGGFANNHGAVDHGSRVAMASACSGCHTASGNTVDPGDAKVHDSCTACHGVDGALTGSAMGHAGGDCTVCHGGFASIHATQDHALLVALSTDCSGCHGGAQGTAGGMPVGGTKQHTACASCHGGSGALISIASGNGGGAQCNSCHGLFAAKHAATDHLFRVALLNDCADCHGGSEGSASGVPTSAANNSVHDTCGQCHGATGTLSGAAAGKEGATSATPNDCATCHGTFAGNHASVNHNSMVAMNANCAGCHSAFGNTVNPGDAKVHDGCATCHLANGRLTGVAAGKDGATPGGSDGGGDCALCHGGFANNHAAVDHGSRVAMASECSGCHTASGNTVDPGDAKVHDGCTACHAADGALNGSASGHAGGGDCTVCHGGFAAIHAAKDHATLVAISTDCSGCHGGAQGTAGGMPVGGVKQHAACASCHGNSGALISIAAGNGGGAQCNSCHGLFAAKHAATDHAFRVALISDCADCHAGAQGTADGVPLGSATNTRHDTCGQCHGATGALSGSAAGKEGATVGTPNDCATCHGTFAGNHAAVNHGAMVAMHSNCAGCHTASGNTVNPSDAKVHDGCTACHLANGRLTGVAAGQDGATLGGGDGGGDCAICHGGFANNHGAVDHAGRVAMATECSGCHSASGNTVDPADAKVHDGCTACHAADGTLSGSASGHGGGGSCTVCHGGFASIHAAHDHSTRVALSTDCSGCHGGAQGTVNGMPVGGAKQHAACASCHGATGALISIAAGNGGSAQCNTCHGLFSTKHDAADHAFRVALVGDCADCHTGSQGLISGMPVNASDNKKHDACSQCHGTTGALTGSAAGKEGASSTTPNDCATCHGGFAGNHASINHEPMVAMADHCSGCHTSTGNTVDPADPRTHDECASCHDAAGRLLNQANGHDGGTLGGTDGGGDCTVCHGEYLPDHQSVTHDQRSIYFGGTLTCAGCHTSDATVLGYAGTGTLLTQDDVNSLHSRPTGDSCSLCHYYDAASQANPDGLPLWNTVRTAIVDGSNGITDATCMVCHGYNETPADHWNQPPYFNQTTFGTAEATVGNTYSGQTIAGTATDPESDAITYAKVSGPAWLTVAADGTLGGTPTQTANDTFVVRATATGGSVEATLNIVVLPPPQVSQLNAWTTSYSNAPSPSPVAAGSVTVQSGAQRLFLVAVIMEHSVATNPTISVTYGGTGVSEICRSANSQRENIWIGFLTESQIGSGAKALAVTYSGTISGLHVRWASFANVNQTNPFSGAAANNSGGSSVTFGSDISYANNGLTVAMAGNGGNFATGTLTATPPFTPGTVLNSASQTSEPFTTATHTGAGSYPAATQVTWTGTVTSYSALGVVSLQP